MVAALFVSSTLIGRLVTRTGRYKHFMMLGASLLTAGLAMMGTIGETTSLVEIGVFMAFVGGGVGMVMQNLVLVVQNSVRREDMGAGSSLIAFFRSLGGAIGVSVLGAVLATHARETIGAGLRDLGVAPSELGGGGASGVPDVDTLPAPVAHIVEHAFGTGIAEAFLFAVPLGLVALLALSLMRERPLGTKSGIEIAAERAAAAQA